MARTGVAALSVALLLAAFDFGSCTLCYQCNSESDKTCGDPFYVGTKKPVDCTQKTAIDYNPTYLDKIIPTQLLVGTVGATRYCHKIVTQTGTVVRTCLDGDPMDVNRTCRLMGSTARYCNMCDKDLCNGAGAFSLSLPLGLLALVASYLFYLQ